MNSEFTTVKALGLASGGLDSILAALVLRRQGVDVTWVCFETPFFNAEKARKAASKNKIPLLVKDITERYLPMLKSPRCGYGQCMNPCLDCHALMFRIAGEMMQGAGCDFLFSGEVLGQRPMSQTKSGLRYVEKHSGFDGRILRPLSALCLPETRMEKEGLVDRQRLCDLSGRSRKPQLALAEEMGVTDYPAPAGGCLLTDPGYSRRLKDLFDYRAEPGRADFELLKHGRHLRTQAGNKIVVGRNQSDNERIMDCYSKESDILIRMKSHPGPAVLLPHGAEEKWQLIRWAAAVCAGYSKAPAGSEAEVTVHTPAGPEPLRVTPVPNTQVQPLMIP